MSSNWISVDDRLPKDRKYVIVRYNRENWRDSDDQEGVICVVAKLVKGLSKEERDALPEGDKRKTRYYSEDEKGNNTRPFNWSTFGAMEFFGQDISHWSPLPTPPEGDK